MEKTFVGVPMTRVTMVLSNALPVMGGMVSQNVLNLVDAAMIARLGTVAVAAVGLGSTANFQCQALLQGVSSAVQAIAARSYGKSMTDVAFAEKKEIARPLNAAIVIVLFFGFPLAWWCYHNCAWFVPTYYASRDAAVASATVPYLRARLLAVPAVGINFAFRGFWNAIQQPQVYMNTLVVMHITNITVSFMLIWGVPALGVPKLGVAGAGLGTAFSVWVGTAMYIYQGFKRAKKYGFGFSLRRREGGAELDEEFSSFPTKEEIMLLIKQALPTGITNVLYASAMVFMYAIVGAISTTSVVAVNVLINLMLVLVLPCMGMGLAAGALSGRALGAGDVEDAKQWPWDVSKITAAGMSIFGLLIALFPQPILSVFLTDPEAIRVATMPLRLTGLTACGDAVSLTMQNALLGVGDVKTVALVSILAQWAVFLPIAWFSVHKLNQGLFLRLGDLRLVQSWRRDGVRVVVEAREMVRRFECLVSRCSVLSGCCIIYRLCYLSCCSTFVLTMCCKSPNRSPPQNLFHPPLPAFGFKAPIAARIELRQIHVFIFVLVFARLQ